VTIAVYEHLRAPQKIHFGVQTNLFDSGRRQEKAALAMAKAAFSFFGRMKILQLAAQRQFLEPPYRKSETK
jgi:hypothetical protein